ncbi:helix-turn-helix transcriptional regulator [Sorangium cellulosum]|nr:hypothetical protein [Sorangium cellulosum]
MWLVSPLGLAMMACIAIGFAVTAREALGRERGLREAGEQRHEDEESALTDAKDKAERELVRHQRLLDCHVDAVVAAMTGGRARPVPWPGRVLETFCATVPGWQRKLAESTGLAPKDFERLLKSDLPITPVLARQIEAFTGTPARYWELLWRVHDDFRTDLDETVVVQLGAPITKRESSARAPASSPMPASSSPPETPRRALDVPPPVMPIPDLVGRSPRAKLPPRPPLRLRSPLPSRASSEPEPEQRAATLTSLPVQGDERGPGPARGPDCEAVECSSLSTTLPGVGRHGAA